MKILMAIEILAGVALMAWMVGCMVCGAVMHLKYHGCFGFMPDKVQAIAERLGWDAFIC